MVFLYRGDGTNFLPVLTREGSPDVIYPNSLTAVQDINKFTISFDATKDTEEFIVRDSLRNRMLHGGRISTVDNMIRLDFSAHGDMYKMASTFPVDNQQNQNTTITPVIPPLKIGEVYPDILGLNTINIGMFIQKISMIIPQLLGSFFVLVLVVLAFRMMTLEGNKNKTDEMIAGLKYAAVGFGIILFAWILLICFDSVLRYLGQVK
jgi:hypothetical protein